MTITSAPAHLPETGACIAPKRKEKPAMTSFILSLYLAMLLNQTHVAGLSPLQVATEFPMMAGTSISEPSTAATPGFFMSGIGIKGTADNP
jgi:hypothetical protein